MSDTPVSTFDPEEQPRPEEMDRAETVPPAHVPAQPRGEYKAAALPPVPGDAEWPPSSRNLAPPPRMSEARPSNRRSSPMLGCLTSLALLLALLSLALNVYLLYVLSSAQQAAVDNIDAAILALEDLSGTGFHYEYQFNQDIPVVADIPIEQEMIVPFEGNLPINTTIQIPIDAGLLGTFAIDVPIDTNVYVNTEVPLHIDQTFTLNTSIPISMTMPIDIGTGDAQIEGVLDQVQLWLIGVRDSLSHALIPVWLPIGDK